MCPYQGIIVGSFLTSKVGISYDHLVINKIPNPLGMIVLPFDSKPCHFISIIHGLLHSHSNE